MRLQARLVGGPDGKRREFGQANLAHHTNCLGFECALIYDLIKPIRVRLWRIVSRVNGLMT